MHRVRDYGELQVAWPCTHPMQRLLHGSLQEEEVQGAGSRLIRRGSRPSSRSLQRQQQRSRSRSECHTLYDLVSSRQPRGSSFWFKFLVPI